MQKINHPESFKNGIRVLLLTGRNKDNVSEQRRIFKISKNVKSFERTLDEFMTLAKPGERIYASASSRDLDKAIRHFEYAQLDARHNKQQDEFYWNLNARWVSALMDSTSVDRADKLWLVDCDSEEDRQLAVGLLDEIVHGYDTKNGHHFLIKPQDKRKLTDISRMLDTNPLMLWAY